VADQLKLAEGWVRCGQCETVFDAQSQIQLLAGDALTSAAPVPATAPAPVAATTPTPDWPDPLLFPPGLPWYRRPAWSTWRALPLQWLQQAQQQRWWWAWVGGLVLGLMLGGLGLQVLARNHLVVWEPRLRPWLTRLCAPLGCTVAAPRRVDAVVLDGSTFSKVRTGVFRLSFTVRNVSAQEVQTPAVELTLTDAQDQPVLRRVFLPTEVGAAAVLAPNAEWNAVLSLNVESTEASERISGYRLWVFYP
jgi:hypothetical protein